jgi:hypothetical protein
MSNVPTIAIRQPTHLADVRLLQLITEHYFRENLPVEQPEVEETSSPRVLFLIKVLYVGVCLIESSNRCYTTQR